MPSKVSKGNSKKIRDVAGVWKEAFKQMSTRSVQPGDSNQSICNISLFLKMMD